MPASAIVEKYLMGLLTEAEATTELDTLKIRGAFDTDKYFGYDYINQHWITIDF